MSPSEFSIRRPVSILMLYTGIVILGIIAFRNLSVDFLPPVRIPRLTILTICADSSPEEIETSITQPVETAVGTLPGVKKISSISRDESSVVMAEFTWGTDMDFALLDAREKLDRARLSLPRNAGRPTIFQVDPASEPIMTLILSMARGAGVDTSTPARDTGAGSGVDLIELQDIAGSLIKRRIEQLEGVARASILGGVDREIEVSLEMQKLEAYGLTVRGVSRALAQSNMNVPGGTITQKTLRYPLRTLGELGSLEAIRHVVAGTTASGIPLRLGEIATVRDTLRERRGLLRANGREVIALEVRKTPGTNTVEVSRRVRTVLDELRSAHPRLVIDVFSDQAEVIDNAITDVEGAIVVGGVLAFLVLFQFLRTSAYPLIIGITMPVSVIATFLMMYLLNIDLNVVSLTGLALGIGMLGDNATIMIENISRLREGGTTLIEATLAGTHEISTALTASTLTNVAIFFPMVFVKEAASQLFIAMGATMTISLLLSLIVAVTLVPMLVSRTGSHNFSIPRHNPRLPGRVFLQWSQKDKMLGGAYQALDGYLRWALRRRAVVLVASAATLGGSVVVAWMIPVEPAPDIDQHGLSVQVNMPRGTPIGRLADVVARLETEFLTLPDVQVVFSRIGITDDLTLWTADDASTERAVIDVRVRQDIPTQRVIDAIRTILRRNRSIAAGAEFAVRRRETTIGNILRPGEDDVRINIRGNDLVAGMRLAREISVGAAHLPGVVDLRQSMIMDRPEYRITVDHDAAARCGLSVEEVVGHLADLLRGFDATSFSGFDEPAAIRVLPKRKGEWTINDLLSSTVAAGKPVVPLWTLVHCEKTAGFSEIRHEGRQRTVVLSGNIRGGLDGNTMEDLRNLLRSVQLPAGSGIELGGRIEENRYSLRNLLMVIGLSILLVYMILAAEYESFLFPLVILLTSPLAFTGAILAMVIAGQGFNIMSLIGIVIMIGAVDNDAVIAVDMMATLRREGMPMEEAVLLGMRSRLRPILMTTATTVFGVIPLVFEAGSGFAQALTVPLVGGMIASTFFTLAAIPVVFSCIGGWTGGVSR